MSTAIYLIIAAGIYFALIKLLPKAGIEKSNALIPGLNIYYWLKVIHKPWWWLFLLIFPGVNILMLMIMSVNLGTVFGKRTAQDVLLNAFFPFITLAMLGLNEQTKYLGPIDRKKFKKNQAQEWRDAILFAVVAASLIRTYFLEAFTIPTSSMEKSLLVGDFLFVSKAAYGPKVPQTPLAIPFAHHTMPLSTSLPSYLEWIKLPYMRLPGFGDVQRNDVVVFNFPAGDTVIVEKQEKAFEQIAREEAYRMQMMDQNNSSGKTEDDYLKRAKELLLRSVEYTVRPVDKREHYIKRCVAVGGDELEVKSGVLYVNGETAFLPPKMQYNYFVGSTDLLNRNTLKEQLDISFSDQQRVPGQPGYIMPLTFDAYEQLNTNRAVLGIQPSLDATEGNPTRPIFPNHSAYDWTEDNFGPITIPKKGETVALNTKNLPIYRRIINAYEGNKLNIRDGEIYINDIKTGSYTFKMDYYFMMGDNRHNSADSRFWGFVPEDHIVGKGSFVWLSLDKEKDLSQGKIRWSRLFSIIQ